MTPEPKPHLETQIQENIAAVQSRIAAACQRSGRDPDDLTLVAVSKFQPAEKIAAAYAYGLRHFGENYLQEALEKQEKLAGIPGIHWHMVGHVQSRKARDVAGRFALVHSVDSLKLAKLLAQNMDEGTQELLLQVNLADEASKSGLEADFDGLLTLAQEIKALPRLRLRGLMCMPPLCPDPEASRPWFKQMAELAARLNQKLGEPVFNYLSMGTSHDFEAAIEEGATHIRLGECIFGERPSRKQAA